LIKSISEFEAGWEKHEKNLKKYNLNSVQFKDWQLVQVGAMMPGDQQVYQGQESIWYNSKTGAKQTENPGLRYFQINKKSMRNRAEEKFKTDVLDLIEEEKIKFDK